MLTFNLTFYLPEWSSLCRQYFEWYGREYLEIAEYAEGNPTKISLRFKPEYSLRHMQVGSAIDEAFFIVRQLLETPRHEPETIRFELSLGEMPLVHADIKHWGGNAYPNVESRVS